ncbi:MAG: sigma 54-interacting transcriptional regulator [Proteobacteria bacterium]|nr:sigma 54-interacting transcriptional regulator [Pseudomonadota bacterium]MBU1388337.1 sigma 54-interacting transcriptional regulator [Pseudomonadota bacterium]MBU1542845.1 sigma 54-interacting transcriptional regulator [Pseudomonadota bacterium]
MKNIEAWPGAIYSDQHILAIAALFDGDFSIDWIQELAKKTKTTALLMLFEKACKEKLLKKKDLGVFSFADTSAKEELKDLIPIDHREKLHKKIAAIMIDEAVDFEQVIMAAASQLMHVDDNNLDNCRILVDAADRYRQKGVSEKALQYYGKVIDDLKNKKGTLEDQLFVKTVLGYSKDRLSLNTPEKTVSLLMEALKRIEKSNEKSLEAIIYLHMASVEYQTLSYISAHSNFHRGSQLAKEIHNPMVQQTLDTSSVLHYCYSGRFKDAIKKYESLESVFSKKEPRHRLSLKFGIMLGLCYAFTGQISQGLGLVNQVRDDALNANDRDAAARASIYMAWILMMKNDIEGAASQLSDGLKFSGEMDIFTKSIANLIQAYIFFEKNEIEKSHEMLKKTLNIRKKYSFTLRGHLLEFCLAMERGIYPAISGLSLEEEIQKAIDTGNIFDGGMAYRYHAVWQQEKHEPHEEVLKSLNRSLELLEESGVQYEVARTKEVLARYFLEQNNIPKAKEYVQDAATIFQKYGERRIADDLKHLLDNIPFKEDVFEEILNFGSQVLKIQDIKKVSLQILSTVIKIAQAERGALFLYSEESGNSGIELLAGKNLSREDIGVPDFELSSRMIIEAAKTGQSKLGTMDSDLDQSVKNVSIKSRICVPLMRMGKSIGVLYHDNRLFPNQFKKQDLKILSYFASLAAIALENASAYEKIQSLNQRLFQEKNYLEEQQLEHLQFEDFVVVSPAIKKVLSLAGRVADTDTTVLILGDTGVGKEMVARAIHQQSSRRDKPFIRVNCSAFTEDLIASELFGHEKGSFTGADKKRVGRFELADTGTLFLDEIGDISKDIQVRLLRVLQTKKFERVGSSQSIRSDFRLLTATNRNLEKEVAEGRFREDLYYRLNVFPIYVPPLRERMEDISPLAIYFLKKYADKMNKSFKGIPESEMNKLLAYHWPGNVRELENVIERGVILNSDAFFTIPELSAGDGKNVVSGQLTLEEMERRFILNTVQKVNWKIHGPGGAAELLGMNHSTLYSRMKKLGLKKPKTANS